MPHKVFCAEQFEQDAMKLKGRFNVNSQDSLYPEIPQNADSGGKAVPIDGLSIFIDSTWDVIKNQKELNLPDQREMVAQYRCTEVKDEALLKVKDQIAQLEKKSAKSIISDFSNQCLAILKTANDYYQEEAA